MVIWLIGMSGAGKTAVARELYASLKPQAPNLVMLDGDLLREVWGSDLGHTLEGRRANSDRIRGLCKLLDAQGIHVICAVLSIFPEAQRWNRENYTSYFEVYLRVAREELFRRDSKGLYRRAAAGEIPDVVGVQIPFPEPSSPDLVIDNEGGTTVGDAVAAILDRLSVTDGSPASAATLRGAGDGC